MKRWLGLVIGIVVAVIGTAVLTSAVNKAREDARKDEEPVKVYVVSSAIPRATRVAELKDKVTLTEVPSRLVAATAVTDFTGIDPELVTSADLLPGDQLTQARLTDPRLVSRVAIPDGLMEITIALTPERALGGALVAGDKVGVLASFSPPDPAPVSTDPTDTSAAPVTTFDPVNGDLPLLCTGGALCLTDVVIHKVLVTSVQFGSSDVEAVQANTGADQQDVAQAPSAQVLVTLAVSADDAARIAFAGEFGKVWLTLEGPRAQTPDTDTVFLTNVFPGRK